MSISHKFFFTLFYYYAYSSFCGYNNETIIMNQFYVLEKLNQLNLSPLISPSHNINQQKSAICRNLDWNKWHADPLCFQFSSVQSLSRVQLFATPWIAARQASLSITISQSSLRLTSIESIMPSSRLILGHPVLLLPQSLPASKSFPMSQLFTFLNFSFLHVKQKNKNSYWPLKPYFSSKNWKL